MEIQNLNILNAILPYKSIGYGMLRIDNKNRQSMEEKNKL
jgi:hypothetical protein